MAVVNFDTELMDNHVAALPVAAGSSFVGLLHPVTRRTAVLGISNEEPNLNLIMEDETGHYNLVKLGTDKLNIPSGSILKFSAQQDEQLNVYLVVAFKTSDTVTTVMVVEPFSLTALDNLQISTVTTTTVEQFFMGPVTKLFDWPLIIIAHVQLDRYSGGSDISSISVKGSLGQAPTVTVVEQFKMPENATRIIDVCAASSNAYGKGLWTLYEIAGTLKLIGSFQRFNGDRIAYRYVTPACPPGATCIESYVDTNGDTGLLIGAERGLHGMTPIQSHTSGAQATLLSDSSMFQSPINMLATQDGPALTVWSVGSNEELGYIRSMSAEIDPNSAISATLMPHNSTSQFAATVSQPSQDAGLAVARHTLLTIDDFGNFKLLTQNVDTGLWTIEPLLLAELTSLTEVQSYTITISVASNSNIPVVSGSVRLVADSTTQLWVNGKSVAVSSLGTQLSLDNAGELNLIVPTRGLVGRTLSLSEIRNQDGKIISDDPVIIDPTAKVMTAFKAITADTSIGDLKGKSGNPLYGPDSPKPSDADLQAAAQAFAQLHSSMDSVSGRSSVQQVAPMMQMVDVSAMSGDVADTFMDGWHWIENKVEDVADWVVKQVDGVAHFVCTLAGEACDFVLDCVEKVTAAFSWVWNKIKLGWQELLDFAGFIFMWSDILVTKDTISKLLTATLQYGSDRISQLEDQLDSAFDTLQEKLSQPKASNPNAASTDTLPELRSKPVGQAQSSTAAKWVTERIKNGGAATSAGLKTLNNLVLLEVSDIENALAPLEDKLVDWTKSFGHTVVQLFQDAKSLTSQQLWTEIGDNFASLFLDVFRTIAKGIMQLGKIIVDNVKAIGNAVWHIPVISKLYENISGQPPSFFDVVSLLLGCVSCITSKFFAGQAPPTFGNIDDIFLADIFGGTAADTVRQDFALFGSSLAVGVVDASNLIDFLYFVFYSIFGTVKAAVDSLDPGKVLSAMSCLASVGGLIAAWPTDTDDPAYKCREAAVSIRGLETLCALIEIFAKDASENIKKKIIAFRVALNIAIFGLYDAVYGIERDSGVTPKEKDAALIGFGITENIFTLLVFGAECVVKLNIDADPEVAGIALAVQEVSGICLGFDKGATFARVSEIKPLSAPGVPSGG